MLKLLKTNTLRLEQAFEDIARSDLPLIIEEDFEDIEDDRYYSFSGLERISVELSEKLTNRLKRLYVARVPKVAIPIIEHKATPKLPLETEINRAKKEALKKQNNQCQITGETQSKTMILDVHHLYNKSTYPELAAEQDNLLVIKPEIHQEFHCWHQGSIKPCTISDFRLFIEAKYSSNYVLLSELDDRKRTLEAKLKYRSKFPALPASSPTPAPIPTPSKTPTSTPSPTPSPDPTPKLLLLATPSPTPDPTPIPTPSPTPTPTLSPTPTPTPSPTPSPIEPSKTEPSKTQETNTTSFTTTNNQTEPSKTQETNTTSFSKLEIVNITSKDSIDESILGKAAVATINNQTVKGKILAISSLEHKRVCFQIKEGELGIWLPESAFIN